MSSIHIARHGQSLGSFNEDEVREGIASKQFVKEDLVWRIGMTSWVPLEEVADAWGFDVTLLGETALNPSQPPVISEPAWERRSELGFVPALFQTVKAVLLAPGKTFSRLVLNGGMRAPLFYYVMMMSVSFAITMLLQLPQILKNPSLLGPQLSTLSHQAIIMGILGLIVISPLLFLVGIYVSSAVTHLSLRIIRAEKKPFEATLRVLCYALGSVALCQLLPFVGGIIGAIWGLVAYFIGLKKVYELSGWRVTFVISISALLYFALIFVIAAVVGVVSLH